MVMDVMAAAARIEAGGARVIHMEVGQPAAAAPASAIAAARAALASGRLGYTETLGMASLRARIARHYDETYGVAIDPERVVVTTGSSAAFILTFLALFEPGDRVAVALPGYPPYRHILSALGCEVVAIETTQATRWAITPQMLLAAHRKAPLKGVLVASPANPTGTMMTAEALRDLIAAAHSEEIRFISDEIYHGLDYAFPAETAARVSDDCVIINSFSKYFCMTGWRVGWVVAPEPLVRPLDRLQGNLANRGRSRVRRSRGDGSGKARLRGQSSHSARRLAESRIRQVSSRRRRVLSLCRRLALQRRQLRIRQAHAGADARGGDARRRFRSARGQAFHPFLLCRCNSRHARSGRAVGELAQAVTPPLVPAKAATLWDNQARSRSLLDSR
jgi:hypothetical protein